MVVNNWWEKGVNWCRVSFGGDENILKFYCYDGCITQ